MAAQELDRSLGELVREYPRLAALFDELGLDYCCGGRQVLAQAGAERGLDLSQLARRVRDGIESEAGALETGVLEGGAPQANLQEMSLAQLVDHIESTHHIYLRDELPRMAQLLETVQTVHGERHPELKQVASVFTQLAAELMEHMHKEERILFPAIRRLVGAGVLGAGALGAGALGAGALGAGALGAGALGAGALGAGALGAGALGSGAAGPGAAGPGAAGPGAAGSGTARPRTAGPRTERPGPLGLAMPIRVMENEHEGAGRALDSLRRLTGGYATPPDGCASWRGLMDAMVRLEQDLHRHIHAENNVLFPRALELESGAAGT